MIVLFYFKISHRLCRDAYFIEFLVRIQRSVLLPSKVTLCWNVSMFGVKEFLLCCQDVSKAPSRLKLEQAVNGFKD